MFEEFLRKKVKSVLNNKIETIYCLSGQWFEENKCIVEAVNCYFSGKQYDKAAELLAKNCYRIVTLDAEYDRYLNWINQLPEHYLYQWPELRISYVHVLLVKFDYLHAEKQVVAISQWLDDCKKGLIDIKCYPTGHIQFIEVAREYLYCLVASHLDRLSEWKTLAEQWLAEWSMLPASQTGPIYTAFAYACSFTYDFEDGHQASCVALKGAEQLNSYHGCVWSHMSQGFLFYQQGCLTEASECYQQASNYTNFEWGGNVNFFQCVVNLHWLAVDWDQGDLKKIDQLQINQDEHMKTISFVHLLIILFTTLIKHACLKKEYHIVKELMKRGYALASTHNMMRLRTAIASEHVHFYLIQNQLDKAKELASDTGLIDNSIINIPEGFESIVTEYSHLTQIRLAQAEGSTEKNILLNRMIQQVVRQKRIGMLIQLLILRSIGLYQEQKTRNAKRVLVEALKYAAPEGYVMRFVYEGIKVKSLLIEVINELPNDFIVTDQFDYFARMLSLLGEKESSAAADADEINQIIEPLSKRELVILKELDSVATNAEIASRLCIAESTLKWHLTKIYSKLDVPNRASAVSRAKKLITSLNS